MPLWNPFDVKNSLLLIDFLNKPVLGIKNGGAISFGRGACVMIVLPITQLQLFISMIIAELFLLGDPNYTVKIGSENYFSLAVGAFVGIIFLLMFLTIRFASNIQFKGYKPKEKLLVKIRQK